MIDKYQKGYYFDTSERYKSNKGYFGKGVWKKNGQKIGLGKISIDDVGDSYQLNSDGTAIKIGDRNGLTNAGRKMAQSKGLSYFMQEEPEQQVSKPISRTTQQQIPESSEYQGLSSKLVGKAAKAFGLDDDLERLGNKGITGALAKGLIDSAMYFTPVGSLISGYDAIQNFRRGNWKAGLMDAAFVLPFIGGLGKLAKVGAKASKTLAKPALKTANRLNRLQKSNVSKFSNWFGLGMVGNDLYNALLKEGGIVKAQDGIKNKFNHFQKFAEEKEKVKREQKEQGVDLESRWNNKLNESTKKVDSKIEKERNIRNKAVQRESRKRNNYVEDITGLQERLFKGGYYTEGTTFEQAVDGIMGKETKKAMAKEAAARKSNPLPTRNSTGKESEENYKPRIVTTGGAYIPQPVIEQTNKSLRPSMENAGDYIGNNPALLLGEDLDRALSNRLTNKLFGIRPFKGRTITNLPSLQKEELIKQIQFAKSLGKSNFDEEAFKKMYGYDYASSKGKDGETRGMFGRMSTPQYRLEHTLGVYPFYEDENGNTIVDNEYDFNIHQSQGGNSPYAKLRNFAGEFASKSTDPMEGKIRYRLNLGKL